MEEEAPREQKIMKIIIENKNAWLKRGGRRR
jgi:hypothetical protein